MFMRLTFGVVGAHGLAVMLVWSVGAFAETGGLTQLPGTDGCVSEDGTGGECADGKGLIGGANAVAVSDDGRHVYVTARGSDALAIDSGAVVVFGRDRRTGALTQLPGTDGCVSEDGTGGECAEGSSLIGTADVAISRDGRHVYVASFVSDAVAVFTRDRRTGALGQVYGVVGNALNGARFLAVSRDGRNVYVTSIFSNAVAVFSRDKWTGVLTQLPGTDGCVSDDGTGGTCANGRELNSPGGVAVSPDGRHVYVASHPSSAGLGAVAVFSRDRRTGALTQLPGTDGCVSEDGSGGECVDGRAIDGAFDVAVTEDGRNVYVVSRGSRAIATFVRDRRTGALTQLTGTDGCVSEDGTGGQCADGRALIGASRVTLSRDGRNVYVTSSNAVAVFARDKRTGAVTQLPATEGCISEDGTGGECADGKALFGTAAVAASRDGRNVYVASGFTGVNSSVTGVAAFARDRHR